MMNEPRRHTLGSAPAPDAAPEPAHDAARESAPGTPDGEPQGDQRGGPQGAGQQTLPFDVAQPDVAGEQPTPGGRDHLDEPATSDGEHAPIAFTLTAAAHRVVDAAGPPPLSVAPEPATDDDGGLDDPTDTRPSRARALRRAGLSATAIADQLGVDELIVRAWIDDVAASPPPRATRRRLESQAPTPPPAVGDDDVGLQLVRAESCQQAHTRLVDDARFALGLGLVAGLRRPDGAGFTIATTDERLAGRTVAWLRNHTSLDDTDVRVVLRLGRDVAGDRARERFAAALQLPVERVAAARARGSLGVDEVEALLRLVEPGLAATVTGWCDAVATAGDAAADAASTF